VGWPELEARDVVVPGDPCRQPSLSWHACIRPGSDVMVENVGLNPLRPAFIRPCRKWSNIVLENQREVAASRWPIWAPCEAAG